MKITAKYHTLLKKAIVQSSELADKDKVEVSKGKTYPIDSLVKKENNHSKVVLGHGAGTWYIYNPHWNLKDTVEDVDQSPTVVTPTHTNSYVLAQIQALNKYTGVYNLATRTNFYNQRDNFTQSHRTCNSSSNAMYADWILRATGRKGLTGDDEYLRHVLKEGDTTWHGVQTLVLKKYYNIDSEWKGDRNFRCIIPLVKAGIPVVVNILHRGTLDNPRGGHVILLIGRDEAKQEWIAHDPYGTLVSNYRNRNGQFSRIPIKQFTRRWQGGYRLLT